MERPNNEQPVYLSTRQVAKAVGVGVTTIKRWVDDGILPAHRTAGGHRKLILADVLRLTREQGLPQSDLSKLVTPGSRQSADQVTHFQQQLQEAARKLDEEQIRAVLRGAFQAGVSIEELADRLIAPTMGMIGEMWNTGRIDISFEHRITQAVVAAIYEIRGLILANASRNRPVAIGGALEHDHYILPSLLAKMSLLEAGWNAINIGPNTPVNAFQSAIETLKPKMLWISVSYIQNDETFVADFNQLYQICYERGVALSLGGRAVTNELRAQLRYTTFGDNLGQLVAFARTLQPPPRRPRRGRPPLERE